MTTGDEQKSYQELASILERPESKYLPMILKKWSPLNRPAQYNFKRGVGRKITFEEAMELEKVAIKNNFITHVPNNAVTNTVV